MTEKNLTYVYPLFENNTPTIYNGIHNIEYKNKRHM